MASGKKLKGGCNPKKNIAPVTSKTESATGSNAQYRHIDLVASHH